MTTSSGDRPRPSGPGTEPLRFGPRLTGSAETLGRQTDRPAGWSAPQDGDTGPVPLAGARPSLPLPAAAPSPAGPSAVVPSAPLPPDVEIPTGSPVPAGAADPVDADPAIADLPITEQPVGRAGRDLRSAIGVGVGLVAVILASLLIWRPAFVAVVTVAVLVAVVELTRALRAGRFSPPLVPLLIGALVIEGLAWARGPTGLVVGFLITALAVLLWRLGDGPVGYLKDAASGVLVALYVPMLAGFAVLLLVPADGATRVLVFIATVVASDVGGYAAGVAFGKHAMAPSISPKKSWEGLAGSVTTCMVVATPIILFGLEGPWWGGLIFGAALAVSATIGDLGESLIKRDLGIKDMGDLLPGHGGIMDRLDSLLPSAALAYLLLSVLVPV
jgi:phosphatidate cytidylyltransferase